MWNVTLRVFQGILIVGALLPVMTGCSSKPVYEKMSTVYVIKLDMRSSGGLAKYAPGSTRDANIDLIDGLVNKELRMQYDQIPQE